MRVAAIYDIHGNLPALEAVLAGQGPARPGVAARRAPPGALRRGQGAVRTGTARKAGTSPVLAMEAWPVISPRSLMSWASVRTPE